jgi:hypothetical protein
LHEHDANLAFTGFNDVEYFHHEIQQPARAAAHRPDDSATSDAEGTPGGSATRTVAQQNIALPSKLTPRT